MALTSIDKVKDVLRLSGSTHDDVITRYVNYVSSWIAGHCKRRFEREADRVEYPRGGGGALQLKLWPIESVAEVKQSLDLPRDYDAADALVEGEDFFVASGASVETNVGVLEHAYGTFYEGVKAVRVTYTGGYWAGDPGSLPAGAEQLPGAVEGAATQMAVHLFHNRDKIGVRHTSIGAMDVSEVQDGLLNVARQSLADYVFMG